MNALHGTLILVAACVAVYLESAVSWPRNWLGAQMDLLPALAVYASLSGGLVCLAVLSVVGGAWFDSLSGNPLGATILPLFIIGLSIHQSRALLLRDHPYAQVVLGAGASVAVPVLSLLFLFTLGRNPIFGWGSLWQFIVLGAGGAVATPLVFRLLDRTLRALSYQPMAEPAFRADREINRGRF